MKTIRVNDKDFSLYLDSEDLDKAVSNIALRINEDYKGKKPLFLVILNGAFIFAADLLRKTEVECDVSFVKLFSQILTHSNTFTSNQSIL